MGAGDAQSASALPALRSPIGPDIVLYTAQCDVCWAGVHTKSAENWRVGARQVRRRSLTGWLKQSEVKASECSMIRRGPWTPWFRPRKAIQSAHTFLVRRPLAKKLERGGSDTGQYPSESRIGHGGHTYSERDCSRRSAWGGARGDAQPRGRVMVVYITCSRSARFPLLHLRRRQRLSPSASAK